MDREVVDLYLDDIIPNRFQPREVFNEQALRELSESIKAHGVIQPIIVRKIGDKYEIIAGERRYKASAMAGLTKIPAIIRNLDDKETSKVALLENLQRKDLTPIEEARTYQKILELDSMTQEELGRSMGKSQGSIANKMRLLSLPDEIQEALLNDRISERHARSLLNLDTSEEQIEMLHRILNNRMTVRELDSAIKRKKGIIDSYESDDTDLIPTNHSALVESVDNNSYRPSFENNSITTPKSNDVSTNFQPFTFKIEDSYDSPTISNTPSSQSIKPKLPKTTYTIEELLDDEELFSLRDAVREIREKIEDVSKKGFVIKVEEMDFEKTYQVIVKIEKDK